MGFFENNYQHNSNSNNPRIKWEYREICLSMVNDNTSDFNALGEEGWEMCGYDAKFGVAVFKRIKK